ncbi:MAG: hypothetical protein QM775_02195 [Pirellulales bacterium]
MSEKIFKRLSIFVLLALGLAILFRFGLYALDELIGPYFFHGAGS